MKRKIFWTLNFSILTLFTAYALASVLGVGANKAYAKAISNGNMHAKSKHFVVVEKDKTDAKRDKKDKSRDGAEAGLGTNEEVCSLDDRQAAELDAFFTVKKFDVKISSSDTVTVAAVTGRHLTKGQLMDFLQASDQDLDCSVVQIHHIFFLPLLPQIS